MSEMASNIIRDVCLLSLEEELEGYAGLNMNDIIFQSLSDRQVEELAIKINLLPSEYREILFFRYCFNNTPSETDKIFGVENSKGKLRYIHKILSSFMGLDDLWIDNYCMKKACDLALMEDKKDYEDTQILYKPNYSKDFRKKLKDVKINHSLNSRIIQVSKRVAIFLLVSTLSFSTILAVNVEAREKVFYWVVERFEEYSIFTSKKKNEDINTRELISFKINYIPIGFELKDIHEGRSMLIYEYITKDNEELIIKLFSASGNGKSYYDTEDAEVEEFVYKDLQGFTWQKDRLTYLVYEQGGIEYHISGNLSKEEILKVAENISK